MPVEVMQDVRAGVRLHHPRGLRALGDLAGGLLQPPRPRAQAGLDRHADRGRRDEGASTTTAARSSRASVGEIVIRGHNVMKGYWSRPDATAEVMRDGWFHTGDMATVDEDGYFFIVDRKKDMIIRGGYNVYPREIEEVLYEHPAVSEAAVVGVPGRRAGRGGRRGGRAEAAPRPAPTTSARSSRSASPPTSTRARSGSPTSCPRARRARSSSARSRRRRRSPISACGRSSRRR